MVPTSYNWGYIGDFNRAFEVSSTSIVCCLLFLGCLFLIPRVLIYRFLHDSGLSPLQNSQTSITSALTDQGWRDLMR